LIERGKLMITAPGRDERLFPFDKLGVIGTDEQLSRFSKLLETPMTEEIYAAGSHYSLHPVSLDSKSPYLQKTIRNSGIREQTNGLVVGIERKGQRILNPASDLVIEPGDLLWIVGDMKKISALGR
jgi:CPA2 family monovalent cation:H+ antiporter-2